MRAWALLVVRLSAELAKQYRGGMKVKMGNSATEARVGKSRYYTNFGLLLCRLLHNVNIHCQTSKSSIGYLQLPIAIVGHSFCLGLKSPPWARLFL